MTPKIWYSQNELSSTAQIQLDRGRNEYNYFQLTGGEIVRFWSVVSVFKLRSPRGSIMPPVLAIPSTYFISIGVLAPQNDRRTITSFLMADLRLPTLFSNESSGRAISPQVITLGFALIYKWDS